MKWGRIFPPPAANSETRMYERLVVLLLDVAAVTNKGLQRETNQDFYYTSNTVPYTFVVCDGMGGHASGDVASSRAAQSIGRYIEMHAPMDMDSEDAGRLLGGAVKYANSIVFELAKCKEHKGMGTTVDVCLVDFDMLYTAHVGDGRVYIFRDGQMKLITTDHTLINELIKNGTITAAEAKNHPSRHVITRAVGTESDIKWDFSAEKLQNGDIILMCTDGLYNMLSEREIKNILISSRDLNYVADTLVRQANEKGGSDNITAILIGYEEDEK